MCDPDRARWWQETVGDGDITRGWWLGEKAGLLDQWGYPKAWRQRIAPILQQVYPPEFCLASNPDKDGMAIVAPYFIHMANLIPPSLELARNLELIGEAALEPPLIKRLRNGKQLAGAEAELSVWAGLRHAGFGHTRAIPASGPWLSQPNRLHRKRPDLEVFTLRRRYLIEVKSTGLADTTWIERSMQNDLSIWFSSWADYDDPWILEFIISAPPGDRRTWFTTRRAAIDAACRKAANKLKRNGIQAGEFAVPGFGRMLVSRDGEMSAPGYGICLANDLKRRKAVDQVLRLVRDAASKFAPGERGIALIDIGSDIDVEAVLKGIDALSVDDGRRLFLGCSLVVLRTRTRNLDDQRTTDLVCFPLTMTELRDETDRRVVRALAEPPPPDPKIKQTVRVFGPPWDDGLVGSGGQPVQANRRSRRRIVWTRRMGTVTISPEQAATVKIGPQAPG